MTAATSLNDCRDEAGRFLASIGDKQTTASEVMTMLDEEIALLKASLNDRQRLSHQAYDVVFLLFELAALHGVDLDGEWAAGRERKRSKYGGEG